MTTANVRGGFVKTLSISRDGSSASNTILKSAFLKKTENYVCQMTQFITNITPPLNELTEVMFEILVKGDENDAVADEEFDTDDWTEQRWTQFTPTPHFSLMGLAQQLQRFFHEFGFRRRTLGILVEDTTEHLPFLKTNWVLGEPDSEDSDDSDADLRNFTDKGWGGPLLPDEGRMVQFKLLPDGKFSLVATEEFLSDFYIRVGPQTQKLTGFPEYMFLVQADEDGDGEAETNYTGKDGVEHLFTGGFENGVFVHDQDVKTKPFFFNSKFALNAFDHRLTMDVVATFPLSNRISVVDGVETSDFILVRFPLADYKRFETELISTATGISSQIRVTEDVNVGLEDLTRGNPDITSVFMLPGNIQQVNLQLWTRYYNEGQITRKKTDMTNGFWSGKLLFSKKQT